MVFLLCSSIASRGLTFVAEAVFSRCAKRSLFGQFLLNRKGGDGKSKLSKKEWIGTVLILGSRDDPRDCTIAIILDPSFLFKNIQP